MSQQIIPLSMSGNPLDGRRALHAAALAGPSAIEAASGAIVVLRYPDVQRLLLETKLAGIGLTLFDHMAIAEGPLREWYGALMFTNEGRPHHRLRNLVGKAFSPRSVEALRPIAASIVTDRLAPICDAHGGDLVEALGDVPMHVMCRLLGVPDVDVPAFIAWVEALSPTFGMMTPPQIGAATQSILQLLDYTTALCRRRDSDPGDDLISGLIAAEHEGDRLTRKETAAMVANLLVGGHDTTSSQIACTLHMLLPRPEVLAQLRAEPALIPGAVNETIRLEPSLSIAPRTVVTPLEVCGEERGAGSLVWLSTMTANTDPDIWQAPHDFDLRRFSYPGAPKMLTFGGGPHACLGTWLARLTIEETVRGVAALAPELTAAPADIPWITKLGSNPASLPVSVH